MHLDNESRICCSKVFDVFLMHCAGAYAHCSVYSYDSHSIALVTILHRIDDEAVDREFDMRRNLVDESQGI